MSVIPLKFGIINTIKPLLVLSFMGYCTIIYHYKVIVIWSSNIIDNILCIAQKIRPDADINDYTITGVIES